MMTMGHDCNPDEWRLFTDLSKLSLKVVFLHKDSIYSSVPIGPAMHTEESYENM
jgi:hypothetical protein